MLLPTRRAAFSGLFILLATFGGCAQPPPPRAVPAVSRGLVEAGRGIPATTLEEGHRLYVGACARCHSPAPVNQHNVAGWQRIVQREAPKADLDSQGRAALLAYLTTASRYYAGDNPR